MSRLNSAKLAMTLSYSPILPTLLHGLTRSFLFCLGVDGVLLDFAISAIIGAFTASLVVVFVQDRCDCKRPYSPDSPAIQAPLAG